MLKSYRRILKEYQIENPSQVRVVATSAVREATNRLAFVDRIYIATGFQVEPLDEAEVIRITFLGMQPFLLSDPTLAQGRALVTEVGGGSTELLLVKGRRRRLFAYVSPRQLATARDAGSASAPTLKVRNIMETHIHRTVAEIAEHVSPRWADRADCDGRRRAVCGAAASAGMGRPQPGATDAERPGGFYE